MEKFDKMAEEAKKNTTTTPTTPESTDKEAVR